MGGDVFEEYLFLIVRPIMATLLLLMNIKFTNLKTSESPPPPKKKTITPTGLIF